MTLPSSGPLSLNDIQTEFGGTNPIGINEYYAGGGLVPAGTSGTYGAVPSSGTISIQNFYGTSNYVPVYVEELFQTWLYTGTGATQTITNGINLSTNGGLVWLKERSSTGNNPAHWLFDTNRGTNASLSSNSTANEIVWGGSPTGIAPISTTGFSVTNIQFNTASSTYVSWTFRKQPKFFDVVTYTGTGANRTVAHNLGSVPGCIILKSTNDSFPWVVYHRSLGATKYLILNSTMAQDTAPSVWNNTDPTSTTFTVGTNGATNQPGVTYVAYLFAHDAGGFGLTGTDNVITCGSYVGNGLNAGPTINLGYEPQWLLYKNASNAANWGVIDNMRGWATSTFYTAGDQVLRPNTSGAEFADDLFSITPTGFQVVGTDPTNNYNGFTYIYIAIRRGPMKTPTTGTSVFGANLRSAQTLNGTDVTAPSPLPTAGDWFWLYNRGTLNDTASYPATWARLIGGNALSPQNDNAETGSVLNYGYGQTTIRFTSTWDGSAKDYVQYFFRRAPGFFDVVCYTGNGAVLALTHNLGVVPELIIVKSRSTTGNWPVYSATLGPTQKVWINVTNATSAAAQWNNTSPTATQFTVGTDSDVNSSSVTYVAYLFATLAGVSKVGSYTGTGALQTVNCGFTGGARFVLIKRTDSTGDWYVYDSARGISSGSDPYLLVNSSSPEVTGTNYVDTTSVGFQVTAAAPAGLNANGGTYIFLAIA